MLTLFPLEIELPCLANNIFHSPLIDLDLELLHVRFTPLNTGDIQSSPNICLTIASPCSSVSRSPCSQYSTPSNGCTGLIVGRLATSVLRFTVNLRKPNATNTSGHSG